MTARWAVSIWVAWRFIRKAPARSALIAVLVALPVLAGTFVAVTIRTAELSPQQAAQRFIGNADAVAVVTPYRFVRPQASMVGFAGGLASEPGQTTSSSESTRAVGSVDLPALLPAGARAIPAGPQRFLAVTAGARRAQVPAVLLDLSDPLTRGMYDVRSGHVPRNGQVALTTQLAERLRAHIGNTVNVGGSQAMVSAIVTNPSTLSADEVVGPAESLGGSSAFPGKDALQDETWLISYRGGRAANLHNALAAHGIIYETRAQWEHPSPALVRSIHVNSQGRAILGSIIGFGLAEIVLLAGTAFAVGVRRQSRELGLLRAVGGDERDVRRIILSQGVLLGLAGAIIGVGLGFVAFALARSTLEYAADQAFGPLDAHAPEILGVAAVGVVAALLAAVVPARTSARQSILDMLRTRFRIDVGRVRLPRWVYLALVGGPVLIVGAAVRWHQVSGGLVGANSVSIGGVVSTVVNSAPDDGEWTALISLGAAITLAGIARICPVIVTRLGRRGGRLPLSLRLAVRDAARHRHRTAPAMAAVATVVAGAVLVLLVLSSTDINNRRSYQPVYPVGTIGVTDVTQPSEQQLAVTTRDLADRFGGGQSGVLELAILAHQGPDDRLGVHSPGCNARTQSCDIGAVGIGDAGLTAALIGGDSSAATAALSAGSAIVLDPSLAIDGRVTLDEVRVRHNVFHTQSVELPAFIVGHHARDSLPVVIVSPVAAAVHGWDGAVAQGLIRPNHVPDQETADRVAASLPAHVGLNVERGYHSGVGVVLIALLGGAALAVLLGTSIAVALAMTESRPDMATFAAVGASPTRRRYLAMAQAAAVGSLGTALGLPLGLLVGISLLEGSTTYPFTLPLRWLALLVVAAPLLAVAVAGAVTRSRVPMTRRLG